MAITQIKGSNIEDGTVVAADIKADSITNAQIKSDAAIDASKLAGSIPNSKITDLDASKLTGTVDNARISLDAAEIPSLATSKITTGTFDDARISASSVIQHSPSVDLTSIKQDILILALSTAVDNNKVAHNLPNAFIDQFEGETGLVTKTDVVFDSDNEFISSVVAGHGGDNSGIFNNTAQCLRYSASSNYNHATGDDLTVEWWQKTTNGQVAACGVYGMTNESAWTGDAWHVGYYDSKVTVGWGSSSATQHFQLAASGHDNAWHHIAFVRDSGTMRAYLNGVASATTRADTTQLGDGGWRAAVGAQHGGGGESYIGLLDNFRLSNNCRYPSGTTFPVPTADFVSDANTMLLVDFENASFNGVTGAGATTVAINSILNSVTRGTDVIAAGSVSATGTLVSTVQTAPATVSEMSGVILYTNGGSGAATLGSGGSEHLSIWFTANLQGTTPNWTGTNWTEAASYGTAQTFSGSKKMVKLGKTPITNTGTACAMKAVWANQAETTMETRLDGWAMNY